MLDIDIPSYEQKILETKAKIDAYKPFSSRQLKNLQQWFNIGFVTHSNAIEGNTLTESEVKVFIEDGITIGGKTMRELKETENLKNLTDIIWRFFDSDFILTEAFILQLHHDLLIGIEKEDLGKYRTIPVYISGSDDRLPSSKKIPHLMAGFLDFANSRQDNILRKIAQIQYDFVKIHPFSDGNGRIARLLMNLFLVKEGFLPVIFPVITRLEYIESFRKEKTLDDFYRYFLWQTHQNIVDYLRFFAD